MLIITILDPSKQKWVNHKGVQKLEEVLNVKETCGYVTFIKTGVRDIGCENYDINVHLVNTKRTSTVAKEQQRNSIIQKQTPIPGQPSTLNYIVSHFIAINAGPIQSILIILFFSISIFFFNSAATSISEKFSRISITHGRFGNNKF